MLEINILLKRLSFTFIFPANGKKETFTVYRLSLSTAKWIVSCLVWVNKLFSTFLMDLFIN